MSDQEWLDTVWTEMASKIIVRFSVFDHYNGDETFSANLFCRVSSKEPWFGWVAYMREPPSLRTRRLDVRVSQEEYLRTFMHSWRYFWRQPDSFVFTGLSEDLLRAVSNYPQSRLRSLQELCYAKAVVGEARFHADGDPARAVLSAMEHRLDGMIKGINRQCAEIFGD